MKPQTKPDPKRPTSGGYNTTFDLWSTGGVISPKTGTELDPDRKRWVKNWWRRRGGHPHLSPCGRGDARRTVAGNLMDHPALGRRFLLLLFAGFATLTAAGLHGSSVVMWSVILHEEETAHALLAGTPRAVRSDEWLVWTPSALAQARHEPPFPLENPALGAGRSPQLMSLPVRHFTMLFRPQLWGFFFLDAEHTLAWAWNAKVCGLLAAMFVLLRRLAGGDFWTALLGSAWVFCSGYTQWWFSCPPMLPEMLASWALGLWCVLKIADAPPWRVALPVTAGMIFAAVNFTLCMYPPFQIPLAYLAAAVLAGWLWQRRGGDGVRRRAWPAAGWLGLAAVAVAAILTPFFLELLPTLRLVAGTSYPGLRRAAGGALGLGNLFLGLAEPLLGAQAFPETRVNVCNAAGFHPVWLAAGCWLLAGARLRGACAQWRLLAPLLAAVLGLALFAACPLPAAFGRWTLLSFSTEERCILPVGLGGILLSVLTLRQMESGAATQRRTRLGLAVIAAGLACAALAGAVKMNPVFFAPWRIAAAAALCGLLFGLYLWPAKRAFACVLLAALAPPALMVNPVVCSFAPLTESTALSAVREIRRADPEARWIAYEGANLSAFLASAGVPVLSGSKTVPDLAFLRQLDPGGRSLEIYNRYALAVFQLPAARDEVRFEQINFCGYRVFIHPANPALRAAGARYFVFPRALDAAAADGLSLLRALPERRLWIYEIAAP